MEMNLVSLSNQRKSRELKSIREDRMDGHEIRQVNKMSNDNAPKLLEGNCVLSSTLAKH